MRNFVVQSTTKFLIAVDVDNTDPRFFEKTGDLVLEMIGGYLVASTSAIAILVFSTESGFKLMESIPNSTRNLAKSG